MDLGVLLNSNLGHEEHAIKVINICVSMEQLETEWQLTQGRDSCFNCDLHCNPWHKSNLDY
jgi:hypothetical protein